VVAPVADETEGTGAPEVQKSAAAVADSSGLAATCELVERVVVRVAAAAPAVCEVDAVRIDGMAAAAAAEPAHTVAGLIAGPRAVVEFAENTADTATNQAKVLSKALFSAASC